MDFIVTRLMLFTALLPVAILGYYIYKKDSLAPEPPAQLLKAFGLGVLSCFFSLFISTPLLLMGFYVSEPATVLDCIRLSFFGAAIPEELAKIAMLWWLLSRNNYLDERMDGIVYAVCISLGFAGFENVLYLFSNDDWFTVGVVRALFAVPGHFGFGVLMGYYCSLVKFSPHDVGRNKILAILAPILAHGAYDTLLFVSGISGLWSVPILLFFIYVCHKLWKYGSRRIEEHLDHDRHYLTEEKALVCAPVEGEPGGVPLLQEVEQQSVPQDASRETNDENTPATL